jgi:microcompartment protein CcmL/EutN
MKPLLTKSLSSITLDVKADVGEVKAGVQDATTEIQEVHAEQSKDILDRAIQDQRTYRITIS